MAEYVRQHGNDFGWGRTWIIWICIFEGLRFFQYMHGF